MQKFMHEKVQFWGMFLLHVRRPFQWEELFFLQVLSCLQCTVLLQVGLYVPADSCTNGRADLSGSIMSWLVKMECDKNACASCFQWHQHSCQLWSDHSIEIIFYHLLHFSSNFKECNLLVRFASADMGLSPRSSQNPISHQCRDVWVYKQSKYF